MTFRGCPSTVTVNSGARRSRTGIPFESTTVTSTSITSTPDRNTGARSVCARSSLAPGPAVTTAISTDRMARIGNLLEENRIVMQYPLTYDGRFHFDGREPFSSICHLRYTVGRPVRQLSQHCEATGASQPAGRRAERAWGVRCGHRSAWLCDGDNPAHT